MLFWDRMGDGMVSVCREIEFFRDSWRISRFPNPITPTLFMSQSSCIVLKEWSLLPNALRRFQNLLCSPNLGITRTRIWRLNFAQRPIFFRLGTHRLNSLAENLLRPEKIHRSDVSPVVPFIHILPFRYRVTFCVLTIVFYCIVLMGWSLLPNALRPFKIYCALPNLGITRTRIWRLNFAQRPIFLDSGPTA